MVSLYRSNFQFIWPWEEWAYVLDLPRWAPQRVFVQEVLEREVRLSYWDKVKQVIVHYCIATCGLLCGYGPYWKIIKEYGVWKSHYRFLLFMISN